MLLKPGAVEVAPILNTDQVGNLDQVKRAGAVAVVYSGRDGFVDGNQLVERHLKEAFLRVGFHPWGGEEHSQEGAQALFDGGRVLRRCNGTANPEKGELAVKRKIALRAFKDGAIRHDAAWHTAQASPPISTCPFCRTTSRKNGIVPSAAIGNRTASNTAFRMSAGGKGM